MPDGGGGPTWGFLGPSGLRARRARRGERKGAARPLRPVALRTNPTPPAETWTLATSCPACDGDEQRRSPLGMLQRARGERYGSTRTTRAQGLGVTPAKPPPLFLFPGACTSSPPSIRVLNLLIHPLSSRPPRRTSTPPRTPASSGRATPTTARHSTRHTRTGGAQRASRFALPLRPPGSSSTPLPPRPLLLLLLLLLLLPPLPRAPAAGTRARARTSGAGASGGRVPSTRATCAYNSPASAGRGEVARHETSPPRSAQSSAGRTSAWGWACGWE